MGNALRFLYGNCCKPTASESETLGPHGVSATTVGVSALAQDLLNFEITSQVPEGLAKHVVSSKKAQANWYKKLIEAWRAAKPPPKTPEQASNLIIQTLNKRQKADIEGFLAFYGLPIPHTVIEIPTSLPDGVTDEIETLQVDSKDVKDGDGVDVYVSTDDPKESVRLPRDVQEAVFQRSEARARRDYKTADRLRKKIVDYGYWFINLENNEEILVRKYRIRLRGIDAPEGPQPYGKEAKDALTKLVQGKCLRILVYGLDQYGRSVGDIYCNGVFVQEKMLKKGLAWHYTTYDQRAEFATWEKRARARRIGLWADPNPQKPWEWRRNNPREGR